MKTDRALVENEVQDSLRLTRPDLRTEVHEALAALEAAKTRDDAVRAAFRLGEVANDMLRRPDVCRGMEARRKKEARTPLHDRLDDLAIEYMGRCFDEKDQPTALGLVSYAIDRGLGISKSNHWRRAADTALQGMAIVRVPADGEAGGPLLAEYRSQPRGRPKKCL